MPRRYVQEVAGVVTADEDARLIHCGFLNIGVSGVASGATVSWDLWVDYVVDFFIPRSPSERLSMVGTKPTTIAPNSLRVVMAGLKDGL